MARAKNRSTAQQISDLELEIQAKRLELEVEDLSYFLSAAEAEELKFSLGTVAKIEKLATDYGVKIILTPLTKSIEILRKAATEQKDAEALDALEATA